ncbi:hypothetical protein FTV88_2891 [Heliorestis convoluta]|uniref:Uncharacterized protein n=1 Tax=Heliorestis convoluta TaxID=356322 RepID=A0A5Q2N9N3_9FIRM|nr:hypothetical protein FTV88_2891 [Heliorestis convoluta]
MNHYNEERSVETLENKGYFRNRSSRVEYEGVNHHDIFY